MENLFNVGDRVKIIQSPYPGELGKTCTIVNITNTECQVKDINDKLQWVEYNNIEHFDDGSARSNYFGLNEKLEKAKKDCESTILSAITEFSRTTGLRVTNVIYEDNYVICGECSTKSVTIEARI